MPIAQPTETWLSQEGYKYHCFISWPHIQSRYMVSFAHRLKDELAQQLSEQIADPKIFLDEEDIQLGANWRPDLQESLCESLSMVALCAPIYFKPSHVWCGMEWAAMQKLGQLRLGGRRQLPIIPLIVSEIDQPPRAFSEVQYIDVSHERLRGRSYLRSMAFRETVKKIVSRIEEVAHTVHRRQAVPNCDRFEFPSQSAFEDFNETPRPLPLTA